ncbi:Reverse transcriptase (RNA-dependent DNA polymerase) [Fragilaria crotonensis]|nr:Reverse transcriptase (RNA-dependent DNA polymerase) [Fragilaria crotonensis]
MSSSVANSTISGVTEAASRATGPSNGNGQAGRGNNRGRGNRINNRTQGGRGNNRPARTGFKGDTEGMNANVFECFEEQTDRRQFAKTREALEAYVKKNLKFAEDLTPLFSEEMENPQLEMPVELDPEASIVEKAIWDQELREFVKRKSAFKGNLATIQAVVLGQCSEAMKDKLKSLTEFKSETKINNCFWLLQQIRSITLQFDEKKNGFISIMNAQRSFLNCKQQVGQSPASYLEDLRAWAVTIDHHGGTIAVNYKLIPAVNEDGTAVTNDDRRSRAYEKTLAIALITGSDPSRYGTLVAHLSNQYAMGRDEYPSNVTAAYNLLVNYRTPENTTRPRQQQAAPNATGTTRSDTGSGMTFAQQGSVAGNNGLTRWHRMLSMSQRWTLCVELPRGDCNHIRRRHYPDAVCVHDGAGRCFRINPEWILLDSQSTISVFNNASMLTNIRKSTHTLRA